MKRYIRSSETTYNYYTSKAVYGFNIDFIDKIRRILFRFEYDYQINESTRTILIAVFAKARFTEFLHEYQLNDVIWFERYEN